MVLGIEPSASHMIYRLSATELSLQLIFKNFKTFALFSPVISFRHCVCAVTVWTCITSQHLECTGVDTTLLGLSVKWSQLSSLCIWNSDFELCAHSYPLLAVQPCFWICLSKHFSIHFFLFTYWNHFFLNRRILCVEYTQNCTCVQGRIGVQDR